MKANITYKKDYVKKRIRRYFMKNIRQLEKGSKVCQKVN